MHASTISFSSSLIRLSKKDRRERVDVPRFGFGSCDRGHKLTFEYPIIFWTPRDRCSIAKTSAAPDRRVQKIALPAIVDQADN
jgi:hypothetical protein